ncbi:BTAD domain-containing putative transcriptional regulator [Streptomyces griseorubiginosus]|uniref:AfsR/SARP family transcriptional regulator n=1 Tax=Streptomyces griseorubiginosus TaxID=67304 RepID=UPI0036E81E5C
MWLTVMGPLRAWHDDEELDLGPAKRQALLALLLVRSGQPTSLSTIIDVLWGDAPPSSAANVVYRHAAAIRRLLESQFGTRSGAGADRSSATRLVRVSGGYRLDASPATLDLLRFRELRAAAEEAPGSGATTDRLRLLSRALGLSRGPTAAGIPPHIAQHPYFVAVDSEYLAAVKEAATLATTLGEQASILDVLQPAAAQHPLDEVLQAHLVQSLASTGRQAEALQAYHQVRTRLDEQLGIAPGPELQSVYQEILRRDTPAALHPAVTPPKPPHQHADQRPHPVRPAQLPPDLTVFAGRSAELAQLDELFSSDLDTETDTAPDWAHPRPTVAIGAIVGMAGVGKTTLAVHWAHRVAHRFPDGQLYLNMRGFDPGGAQVTPSEARRTFLTALGVPARDIPPGQDAQLGLYRSTAAGLRLLIVLDNVADSDHVRPLLAGAPGTLVLVTSRDRLSGLVATEGAHPLMLTELKPDEARQALVRRLGTRRTGAEPAAVDEIAAHCARLPLALAIAGAQAALFPERRLASIASEFRGRPAALDAFTDTDPNADIRSVFSWSYRKLAPATARMFRLLALHPGPVIAASTAASLAGTALEPTRELLSELVRAHLLTEQAPDLYVLHDLLGAYARELLRTTDPDDRRELSVHRMLDHYVHTALAAATRLAPHRTEPWPLPPLQPGTTVQTPPDHEGAADWLDRQLLPVLLQVADQAAAHGLHAHVCQLGLALERHLDRLAHWEQQLALQRICLLSAETQGDLSAAAHAHRALGFAHGRLGQHDEARTHLLGALSLFTEADDPRGQAATHRSLAFRANAAGRHDQALDHYDRALSLYRRAGDTVGQGSVFNEVGWTLILTSDHRAALDHCARAIELCNSAGDLSGEAAALDSLGYAHHHLGEYDQALKHYQRALTVYRRLKDRYLEADVLVHIGQAHSARGESDLAARSWERALNILDTLRHPDASLVRRQLDEVRAFASRPAPH